MKRQNKYILCESKSQFSLNLQKAQEKQKDNLKSFSKENTTQRSNSKKVQEQSLSNLNCLINQFFSSKKPQKSSLFVKPSISKVDKSADDDMIIQKNQQIRELQKQLEEKEKELNQLVIMKQPMQCSKCEKYLDMTNKLKTQLSQQYQGFIHKISELETTHISSKPYLAQYENSYQLNNQMDRELGNQKVIVQEVQNLLQKLDVETFSVKNTVSQIQQSQTLKIAELNEIIQNQRQEIESLRKNQKGLQDKFSGIQKSQVALFQENVFLKNFTTKSQVDKEVQVKFIDEGKPLSPLNSNLILSIDRLNLQTDMLVNQAKCLY
ncbi:hypothetical protein pb186bvf_001520 [Paramecium bursaria]